MPRKSTKITVRFFVPSASGGYIRVENLSAEDYQAFQEKIVNRMGAVFQDHFSNHPEEYAKL